MDEKWIEKELGKLASSSSVTPPDLLDNNTRMLIREQVSFSKRRNVMSRLKAIGIVPASALLIILVFLSTLSVLHFTGPAAGGELALGKYVTEDGFSYVILSEDNQFQFHRWIAYSYLPMGTYTVQGDELILRVTDTEEYRFTVEGDTLVFQSGGAVEPHVTPGTVFTYTDEE